MKKAIPMPVPKRIVELNIWAVLTMKYNGTSPVSVGHGYRFNPPQWNNIAVL